MYALWRSPEMFSLFKPKPYEPRFPIVDLYIDEGDALSILENFAPAHKKEAEESDRSISDHTLICKTEDVRITVGIFDGKVRYTSYLTEHYNDTNKKRGAKLAYFVKCYGGEKEFNEPADTGYMIMWRNPIKKVLIIFGLHMGPVRIIDENPDHWND